jgi:glycosyltransferase involved in cell wall biosynthesis
MQREITFIIPCYNEETYVLGETVNKLKNILDHVNEIKYEIIVVDDGSQKYHYSSLEGKDLKLICNPMNLGYGASIITGIHNAKYEWIGIVDADGTYPVEYFKDFTKHIHDNDMIVGKRSWKDIPLIRRFPKFFLQKLASFLADYEIPDLNSGMRLFKKELVQKYIRLFPKRFSFTSTLTMICVTNFYKVMFIDIPYNKRIGSSNIHPIKDTIRFFSLVFRLALYCKPLRFFVPLSLTIFFLAIIRGIRDMFVVNHLGGLSLVLFFMAFQIFFFGLIAEIINKK